MTNLALQLQDFAQVGRLQTAADVRRFAEAGNATFTLRSKASGQRFTYRVRKAQDNADLSFVSLLNGPDNESSYAYFGYVRRGVFFHGGQKARVGRDAPSAKGFAWFWQAVQQDRLPEQVEAWHEGRCGRCNRKLTVPSSIASGIGPDCAEQMGFSCVES